MQLLSQHMELPTYVDWLDNLLLQKGLSWTTGKMNFFKVVHISYSSVLHYIILIAVPAIYIDPWPLSMQIFIRVLFIHDHKSCQTQIKLSTMNRTRGVHATGLAGQIIVT